MIYHELIFEFILSYLILYKSSISVQPMFLNWGGKETVTSALRSKGFFGCFFLKCHQMRPSEVERHFIFFNWPTTCHPVWLESSNKKKKFCWLLLTCPDFCNPKPKKLGRWFLNPAFNSPGLTRSSTTKVGGPRFPRFLRLQKIGKTTEVVRLLTRMDESEELPRACRTQPYWKCHV